MYLLANTEFIALVQKRLPMSIGFGDLLEYDPLQFLFDEREIKNSYLPKYFKVEKIELKERR